MIVEQGKEKKPWKPRLITYLAMLVISLLVYLGMKPDYDLFKPLEALSMILGYMAFLFIALTLLIGPLARWMPGKKGGYLLKARRDVGIWAGLIAVLHVLLVIMIFNRGKDFLIINTSSYAAKGWLGLFFNQDPLSGEFYLHSDLIGMANYLAGIAFIFLFVMLMTSSTRAERLLGGASWKRIHSFNLMVFILIVFHGTIYIRNIKGTSYHYYEWMLWIAAVVLLLRMIAYTATIVRRNRKLKS